MGHHQSKTTEVESSAFFQKEEKPPISVPRSGGDEGTSSQSSSGWHVGHRSQLKRCCRLLQSKLSEVKARADGTALQECEELVRQMEALLSNEVGARPRRVSEENMSPEVQEWLVKQWTESQRLQAQDLSPIRGSSRLRAMRTVPWSEQLGELLEKVGTLDLDVEAIANQPEVAGNVITVLFVYTMTHGDVFDQLTLDYLVDPTASDKLQDRLMKFTLAIDKAYLDMPYHNNTHAADVTMMMHWFFQSSSMSWKTPLDHLLGLAAAVIHDVGHDGVNNMFHVKAQTPVALRYNDRSVLENMHCSLAFELMKENEDLNWISLMTTDYAVAGQKATDLRQYLRRGMIEMVLATDPTKHNVQMDDLKVLVAAKTHPTATTEPTDGKQKQDILNVLLHSADVSNPTRALPVALFWSRRVLLEFWAQGDQEKSLGLEVSPLCDRASGMTSVPQGQLGFIGFIVRPLYQQLSLLLPEAKQCLENLKQLEEYWQKKKEEGASFQQSFAILDD